MYIHYVVVTITLNTNTTHTLYSEYSQKQQACTEMVYNRYMSQQQGRLEEAAVEEGVAVVDWMYCPL